MDIELIIEASRFAFEEKAFSLRFIKSIKKVSPSGPMSLQSVDCPTQAEFVERDTDGEYKDEVLQMLWWGWSEAVRYCNPS